LAPRARSHAASTVAVVVPSTAWSLVFWATSRTIWAPMFSNYPRADLLGDGHAVLVMRGAPKLLVDHYVAALGPSVTRTALARMSTPPSMPVARRSRFNLFGSHSWSLLFDPMAS